MTPEPILEPILEPIANGDVAAVKALIADVVLEFYPDLEFLPKDREGLLGYYEKTGYLSGYVAAISLFRKNGFAECPKYKERRASHV